MLDTHQLHVFVVAAETLNFTEAARQLNMSQPSVSQHIRSLEKHFNTRLFERIGRGIRLTDEGNALLPLAREIVYQSIRIEEAMASLRGEIFGSLLVGCSTTPGKYVLPQILVEFHRLYPKVSVVCQVSSQQHAIELLCSGKIHFALSSRISLPCTGAEFRLFMQDPVVLLVPEDHPWAKQGRVTPEELRRGTFLLREPGSGTYDAIDEALHNTGVVSIHELNIIMTLGNSEAIALAVQEGLGVGFVSHMIATRIPKGGVKIVPIEGVEICRDIYIGRQTVHPATAAQTAFWELAQTLNPLNVCGSVPAEAIADSADSG